MRLQYGQWTVTLSGCHVLFVFGLLLFLLIFLFAWQGILKSLKKNGDGDTDDGDDGADTILMFCLCCEIMIGQGLPLD